MAIKQRIWLAVILESVQFKNKAYFFRFYNKMLYHFFINTFSKNFDYGEIFIFRKKSGSGNELGFSAPFIQHDFRFDFMRLPIHFLYLSSD